MTAMSNTEIFARLGDPERMHRIAAYDIFHPGLRAELDRIAARTAEHLHAPVSMISMLLDSAQFIIGHHGLSATTAEVQGIPAEWALCTHTVLAGQPYCITDGTTDPLHATNPMLVMTRYRSYAGVPLTEEGGHVLGAHCVVDAVPRDFGEDDITFLRDTAAEVMRVLARYRHG
ncbi:hypothetical protein GCM10010168_70520 [Actinoplanes ianthinogenes]|uniref:GAF domain-containing protein n=1 Tax=Actinoplanes ianthinogenes TaxID=122358 RepID=A0ABN6CQ55_9ACTN|nr:GAF domain-containing protein [Actinoplanes ianthinogenes]BCJ47358.1 hypothetical protein Aiant_80150 [Actinoplanes ianthinogenes]GGR41827.1 hypothetical protein GCM10010168_70520 [Actinoplanes ianthinogenes]